jgi:hypothetical protein
MSERKRGSGGGEGLWENGPEKKARGGCGNTSLSLLGVSMEFLVSRSGGRPERHGARSTCRRQRCERKRRTWRRNMEVTAASNWRPRA